MHRITFLVATAFVLAGTLTPRLATAAAPQRKTTVAASTSLAAWSTATPTGLPSVTATVPAAAATMPPLPQLPEARAENSSTTIEVSRPAPALGSAGSATSTVQVHPGWNLISLPLVPSAPLNASTVLTTLLSSTGGSLAALYGLSNNQWSTSLIQQARQAPLGQDFPIVFARAYLLYSDQASVLTFSGTPPTAPLTWQLAVGWNLVGLSQGAPIPLMASSLLQGIAVSGGGSLCALYGLSSDQWSPALIQQSGQRTIGGDYALQPGTGYLLYSARSMSYTAYIPAIGTPAQTPISGSTATATATATAPGSATPAFTATATPTRTTTTPPTSTTSATPIPVTSTATPSATPTPATGGGSGRVQDYPRLASLYSFGTSSQVPAFQRYGEVVAGGPFAGTDGAVQALKSQSPNSKVLLYFDTTAVNVSDFNGMTIYPGWWLTLAGTTLAAPIDATTTTVQVADASVINKNLSSNPDVLVDGETMHVTAVNTSANTLTVQRGSHSTAAAHAAGARIAAHASNWSGVWMLNVSSYCPTDPATGQTWVEYLAHQAQIDVGSAPWDGIFYDNVNSSVASEFSGQLDANNDNIADGGAGPSGTGWSDGETKLFSLTHSLLPNSILEGNGGFYTGASNGEEMEHFPYWLGGWSSGFQTYMQLAGPSAQAAASIINPDTNNTGVQSLQTMRFNLATALMGNGYFSYDFGAQNHGQTWWYDEYDNGAGSSLTAAIDATQTTLALAPGTGSKFAVGDVVHVPDDSTGPHDDEQMLITSINGDALSVQRGYSGTQPAPHPALSKVMTMAQISAGQGWLGQPLGAPTSLAQYGSTLLANGSFDQTGANWLSPWAFGVSSPAAATISQDTSNAVDGQASARIDVSQASATTPWNVSLAQQNITLQAGTDYTVTFWAKGSANQSIQLDVQQASAPWTSVAYQAYTLTSNWQQYTLSFTAAPPLSGLQLGFNLGGATGSVWLDGVRFQQGNDNLWRRDFTHGTVLLNGTSAPQTVDVGSGYRRIVGTQAPAINDGATVSSVTIAPQDAVFLVKTSQ